MGGTWPAGQWADTEKLGPGVGWGSGVWSGMCPQRAGEAKTVNVEHLPCENRNCLYPVPSCACSHMTFLSHLLGLELLFPL